ncbi:protein kinase [Pseudenhygromyxa sp. WMMC2535]|uniref:protein kinase domain-containing protein n=1 Tax=Pseudenhygromyxa sp. WMMC2535 TaxID=2712867 RepID=UPI0015526E43|nr:protein kinase [Pseudenhygromyxa sp. WMMC2535]NVB40614.1 protein kinase [Pseudenhygromyxa sp. WMMC2535]
MEADKTKDLSAEATSGSVAEPLAGEVIGQRWQLDAFIARGGMGRVWRATDLRLRSEVALKLMDPALGETQVARERFMREAQAAAQLRGPNVVQVLDFNVDPHRGLPYMAMELLRGEDLSARLERGRLDFAETLAVLADVAAAISRAHRQQIIHRDLKPGNVFLVEPSDPSHEGVVAKVLDFGIAKLGVESLTRDGEPLTLTGATLGTVSYMSPEQIEDSQSVDHRTDLWSMGVIAYECLCGRRPFRSASLVELIREICLGTPPSPSKIAEVPPGFDAWFFRACAREPRRRFATADELLDALRALAPTPGDAAAASSARDEARPQNLSLESWASDANQIDIRALKHLTFRNAVVSEFLDSANKHFISGSKGLGKTLLLTYKRSLLSEHYQAGTGRGQVKFIPEGRPYLDLMGDLPSVRQGTIDLMTELGRCKRIWGFGLRLSALSHHPNLLRRDQDERENLARLPTTLKAIAEGRQAEPTMVVKELLALPLKQINQVLDGLENFLEHKLRALHSGLYIFIDKLDQALRTLPRAAWVHMQAGMVEAAWDLMNTNRHVKVFATIREEAFSGYESDIKTNLYGATTVLRYTKHDLLELLDKLTYFYERLPLRDFVLLDVDRTFDFIYRHTLGRPRDLVIIASEISRNRRSLDVAGFERIVQETAAGMLVANVFDEMGAFLEVLRDRDQRNRFLALIPYDVLTQDELVEVWCRFHGFDREYYDLHGHDAEGVYHPFRELFDCGLLGVVERDSSTGERSQRFRQPHEPVPGSQRQLPRSREYLLHPALQRLVARLSGGGNFQILRGLTIGHGLPWPRHYGLLVEVQRALYRVGAGLDEASEDTVLELIDELLRRLARGQRFADARAEIAATAELDGLLASLERRGWDELHLALLELFPTPTPSQRAALTDRAEVAMLLVDIVKSTRMVQDIGDTGFVEHLQSIHDTLRGQGRGLATPRVLKGTGDGFLAVYDDVDLALLAARQLRQVSDPRRLRLVIHRGAVRLSPGDAYGSEVHRLFRIEAVDESKRVGTLSERSELVEAPRPGRVMLSQAAIAALPPGQRESFACLGRFSLDGFDEPEEVWVER